MIVITQMYEDNAQAFDVPVESISAFVELADAAGHGVVAVTDNAMLEDNARPHWQLEFGSLTLHLANRQVSVDVWKLSKLSPDAVTLMAQMCAERLSRMDETFSIHIADAEALAEWVREARVSGP